LLQQFDVAENLNPVSRRQYPLLVVLQHDRISSLTTVVAAPLISANRGVERMRLHPAVEVNYDRYLIIMEYVAAVQLRLVGRVVGNVEANRYEIVAGLDMLFTGY
jgi:hypothetical protein